MPYDQSQILTWLSPLDPRLRHQDIQDRRVEDAGEWLLQTPEYGRWSGASEQSESDKAVLFCHGHRGVGKKFIRYQCPTLRNGRKRQMLTSRDSSLVIDSLCDRAGGQDITVTCFYFDRTAQKEQSSTNVLGALLKQVVVGLEEVPREIAQAYEEHKRFIGGRRLQHTDIVKMLQATTSKKRTFICIDALEECMPGHRVKLLNSLNQILQKVPGTKIFLTGRPGIGPEIERFLAGRVTSLSIGLKRGTVTRCPHARFGGDTTTDTMDSLGADIQKKISENNSQILKRPHEESHLKPSANRYLLRSTLVSPDTDAIPHKRQKLCAMPDDLGLEGPCGPTPSPIEGQSKEKVRSSEPTSERTPQPAQPLRAALCHALAVETGSRNLGIDGVPSIGTFLNCRQLSLMADEASMVWLILFILQEYLRAHPMLPNTAHSIEAETCLSYLNPQHVNAFSTSPLPRSPRQAPSRTGRPTQKGTFQIVENSLHWDCPTTIITTFQL